MALMAEHSDTIDTQILLMLLLNSISRHSLQTTNENLEISVSNFSSFFWASVGNKMSDKTVRIIQKIIIIFNQSFYKIFSIIQNNESRMKN